ncbi:MAG TPA: hypothetical protein VFH27_09165 [Longimicrobiaceae bacterium]|nr:hypothetical protein [Longimicrobiaceae bacterium]
MDFPLHLNFKKVALAPQISVTDANGRMFAYVKQKAFKLKEAITIFAEKEQINPLFTINADRILDISARYTIRDAQGAELGAIQRRGMRSFWRASYEIVRDGAVVMQIREENPWVKVLDGLMGEIPVLGFFTGYAFNPAYLVTRTDTGAPVLRIKKEPAFLEGKFSVQRQGELSESDQTLGVVALLMMVLLEKRRG